MKQFYESKEKQLTDQLQDVDKKMMKLFEAYRETSQQLTDVTREKEELEKKYIQQQTTMNSTKEELESIRNNYDQQLTVLSEHITQLNDSLASQSDEINELKATKVCIKCKKPLGKK